MRVTLTENNFSDVIGSPHLVFLHFWSDFCGPCKVQSRVLEQLEEKYDKRVVLGEINSQEQLDWIEAFGIKSTPTTLLFYKGSVIARLIGVHSLSKIEQVINKAGVLE
ncbi:thioredoxin family protein [Alkalibacterium sp. f15]|uniref:thioredoxin family protein n=1 Tax=Alkalibacterium sp. f15 TaxID=3414029 RepID=UPI003BF81EA3